MSKLFSVSPHAASASTNLTRIDHISKETNLIYVEVIHVESREMIEVCKKDYK